jgi:hypothetical protein
LFGQEALLALLFNSALECGIGKGWVIQESFELFGVQQLVVYVDDVSVLVGNIHTAIEKNTENFLGASEEIGLEVNVDKTKYVVMYRGGNAE